MYFPIDDTHPESSASRTSSFSRAPMYGFEIGIKLSDIIDLLIRSNERLETFPLRREDSTGECYEGQAKLQRRLSRPGNGSTSGTMRGRFHQSGSNRLVRQRACEQ